jgi:hypothetical protein
LGDDIVSELNCNEGHIFHTGCLEVWLRNREVCPLCLTAINTNKPANSYGRRAIDLIKNLGRNAPRRSDQVELI